MDAVPFGKLLWFDPGCEEPSLRALTGDEKRRILDEVSSVSAMDEDEDSAHRLMDGGPSDSQEGLPF